MLVLAVAAVASQTFAMPPEPKDLTLTNLTQLEMAWKQKKILNYSFTIQESCFCAPRSRSLEYRVRNGVGQLITNSNYTSARDSTAYSSINALYSKMRLMIKSGGRVAVVMDSKLGIPEQVILDPQPKATDDEMYLSISKFKK